MIRRTSSSRTQSTGETTSEEKIKKKPTIKIAFQSLAKCAEEECIEDCHVIPNSPIIKSSLSPKCTPTACVTIHAKQGSKEDLCISPRRCSSIPKLCLCEVSRHVTFESCWLVGRGNVYDVTPVLMKHPAGSMCILRHAGGRDCTQDMYFHSKIAQKEWEACKLGRLMKCGEITTSDNACSLM